MRDILRPFGSLADWRCIRRQLESPRARHLHGRWRTLSPAPACDVCGGRRPAPIARKPHQPHFQSLDYNPLHGGIERWFEPIEDGNRRGIEPRDRFSSSAVRCFGSLAPSIDRVAHRSAPVPDRSAHPETGRPTPEGLHSDGVDYVLVLLVNRQNIASGVTTSTQFRRRDARGSSRSPSRSTLRWSMTSAWHTASRRSNQSTRRVRRTGTYWWSRSRTRRIAPLAARAAPPSTIRPEPADGAFTAVVV